MRHADPWSVWTRFSVPSLIVLAVWSRVWVGGYSVALVALAVLWMMVNPVLFREPRSTPQLGAQVRVGERIWSERTAVDLPSQFRSPIPNLADA